MSKILQVAIREFLATVATKGFIMKEFLPGEDPDELGHSTPLLSGGILDSISTVKLIGFSRMSTGSSSRPTRSARTTSTP